MLAVVVVAVIGVFLGLGLTSEYALYTAAADGLKAGIVLAGPVLGGLWLVPLFRLGRLPWRWHLLLGATLGTGATSLLVLLLGLAGLLQRPLWVFLQVLFVVMGIVRLLMLRDNGRRPGDSPVADAPTALPRMGHLWLVAVPFLCLGLLAATNPPGFIWREEGFGYDVLEYHLQMPKEYFRAGCIAYAPHNVYANFPAGVEMLYLLAMILLDNDLDVGVVANLIHLALAAMTVYGAWVAGRQWSPQAGVVAGVAMATAGWLTYLSGLAYVENGMLLFSITATAVLLGGDRALGPREQQRPAVATDDPGPPVPTAPLRRIALGGVVTGLACGCKYTALPLIALPLGTALLFLPVRAVRDKIASGAVFAIATLVTVAPWLIKNQIMTGNPVFPLANSVFMADPPGWGAQQTQAWERAHSAAPDNAVFSRRVSAVWTRIAGDHYQRFGPLVLLLPFAGLVGRRRDRIDAALLAMLLLQVAIWVLATHHFARFAVVMLIPLALLCGRALGDGPQMCSADPSPERKRRVIRRRAGTWGSGRGPVSSSGDAVTRSIPWRQLGVTTGLIIGASWNFVFMARLYAEESAGGAPASLIYDGELPGYEYFKVVNRELPNNARILLVGDARAFYFRRDVAYHVVFNRAPFVDKVRAARTDRGIVRWLREQGYTHVLVNWSEVDRLRRTYGFAPEITPTLFSGLRDEGLDVMREFPRPHGGAPYITLYQVRQGDG